MTIDPTPFSPITLDFDQAQLILRNALRWPRYDDSTDWRTAIAEEHAALAVLAHEVDLRDGQTCQPYWTTHLERLSRVPALPESAF